MNKFKRYWFYTLAIIGCLIALIFVTSPSKISEIISPLQNNTAKASSPYEVFGFAPYWNLKKLDNINFNTLTTLAYFDLPLLADGQYDTDSPGYRGFKTQAASDLFNKAHKFGTKVVLTITIMENDRIEAFLDDEDAQKIAIRNTVNLVKEKNLDGINVDIEYVGNADTEYRNKFTKFVKDITDEMHKAKQDSKVTVSVYASAAKYKKLYDIGQIGKDSDGIFMMAYDFATKGADQAMPTSPLYGHKEGKYWYDISTAVEDFLKVMPGEKLILGLPWYGYDYPVSEPAVKADRANQTYSYKYWINRYRYVWRQASYALPSYVQTYTKAVKGDVEKTGWDDMGQVGWRAYKENGTWRMYFLEDEKSLGIKYDFAKDKKLAGVGIWALGFDEGTNEMWTLLQRKFGNKLAKAGGI